MNPSLVLVPCISYCTRTCGEVQDIETVDKSPSQDLQKAEQEAHGALAATSRCRHCEFSSPDG